MIELKDCVNASCHQLGLHLKLSYFLMFPYFIDMKDPDTGVSQMAGLYAQHILPFLLGSMNITYEFIPPTGEFTQLLPNKTWTADFGMLQSREADMNLGPHDTQFQRFEYFRSSKPFQFQTIAVLASSGKSDGSNFFSFLYSMDPIVWYIFFPTFWCLIITTALVEWEKLGVGDSPSISSGIERCFWIFVAALFFEGSPKYMSTRLGQQLLFMWLFAVLVLMNTLTGQFKAVLMIKHDADIINNMKELSERPDVVPMMVQHSILENTFKESSLDVYKQIHRNALVYSHKSLISFASYTNPGTYQIVKDGGNVIVVTDVTVKCILSAICHMLSGNRRLYIIDETFYPFNLGVFQNWDFPEYLANKIDDRILWMAEGGFFNVWFSSYHKNYEKCMQEITSSGDTLKFRHLTSVFVSLCISLSVAFFSCICECIHHRISKGKKERKGDFVNDLNRIC